MNKTLFISDLDGTLLNNNAKISDYTANTLNSMINEGVMFTVASARSIISASDILKCVKWKHNGVFMNGVLLCDINSHKTIDYKNIDSKSAEKLIDIFNRYDRPPTVFSFTGPKTDNGYDTAISVRSGGLKTQADVDFYEERKNKYNEYIISNKFDTQSVVYINGMDDYNTMNKIYGEALKIDSISCDFYKDIYTGLWLLECHTKSASKAKCALYLKKRYNADKLVAFGDNFNDIEMLKSADVAIVVNNAPDEVKEYANIIIDSNYNDGVAKYLRSI